MNFKDYIRVIEDFPHQGISFKDITTLLKDGRAFHEAVDAMAQQVKHLQIDAVAGPEARGFVIGAPLAYALGVGFLPIRKSGKLPADAVEAEYDKEYGKDRLAMHKDAVKPGDRILIADDLLATGGTISTSIQLVQKLGGVVVGAAFLIELTYLSGREKLQDVDLYALMKY